MAIIISNQYPGKTNAPTAAYPQGSARNITIAGDGTGTPWDQDLANDILGLLQAILREGNIAPSGNPDTALDSDYLDGLKAVMAEISTLTGFTITPPAGGDVRAFDPNNYTNNEMAAVLATLIKDLA